MLNWYWAICDEAMRYYNTPMWEHTPSMKSAAMAVVVIPLLAIGCLIWVVVCALDERDRRRRQKQRGRR